MNAIIQKTREMRRGVYYPQLYVVKEDGEMPLRLWALSLLVQDRADVLPSYRQFITQLKDKVRLLHAFILLAASDGLFSVSGEWIGQFLRGSDKQLHLAELNINYLFFEYHWKL